MKRFSSSSSSQANFAHRRFTREIFLHTPRRVVRGCQPLPKCTRRSIFPALIVALFLLEQWGEARAQKILQEQISQIAFEVIRPVCNGTSSINHGKICDLHRRGRTSPGIETATHVAELKIGKCHRTDHFVNMRIDLSQVLSNKS